MRGAATKVLLLAVSVAAATAGTATATVAQPVEGYHDPGNRIGCVMFQAYDSHGNAVKCGRKGKPGGLLLTSAGRAHRDSWSWPARRLGQVFFPVTYGTTYYLYGGTAKSQGDASILRCVFRREPSVRVRCTNGDGYGIRVTRTSLRRLAP
jgi:hypothetical protein